MIKQVKLVRIASNPMSPKLDPEPFCQKMDEWAGLMADAERITNGKNFSRAWQEVRLAISKSCLLSRTLYGNESPSQTPCPVHKGKWSGLHFGWPDAKWDDGSPIKESAQCRAWYDAGCRCFQHGCGCTTGWQPDESCGCLNSKPAQVSSDGLE